MIVFPIVATVAAVVGTLFIGFANGMRSSPGAFQGRNWIIAGWVGAAASWLIWLN